VADEATGALGDGAASVAAFGAFATGSLGGDGGLGAGATTAALGSGAQGFARRCKTRRPASTKIATQPARTTPTNKRIIAARTREIRGRSKFDGGRSERVG
jgi:hypothetical protein